MCDNVIKIDYSFILTFCNSHLQYNLDSGKPKKNYRGGGVTSTELNTLRHRLQAKVTNKSKMVDRPVTSLFTKCSLVWNNEDSSKLPSIDQIYGSKPIC